MKSTAILVTLLLWSVTASAQPRTDRKVKSSSQLRSLIFHCGPEEILECWTDGLIDAGVLLHDVLQRPLTRSESLFDIDMRHELMLVVAGYPLSEHTLDVYRYEVARVLAPELLEKPTADSVLKEKHDRLLAAVRLRIDEVDSLLRVLAIDGCVKEVGCADAQFERASSLVASLKDSVMLMQILLLRAHDAFLRGDFASARTNARFAMEYFSKMRICLIEGRALLLVAKCAWAEDNLLQARREADRALLRFVESDDPIGQAKAHLLLARIASSDYQEKRVATHCRKGLEILATFPVNEILSETLILRASLARQLREHKTAKSALRSLQLAGVLPVDLRLEMQVLAAIIAADEQRPSVARDLYRVVLEESVSRGYRWLELQCRRGLAEMYHYTGENGRALLQYQAADSVARVLKLSRVRVELLRGAGDVFAGLESWAEASLLYDQGLEIARKTRDEYGQSEMLIRFTDMHILRLRLDSARHILSRLRELIRVNGAPELVASYFLLEGDLHRIDGDINTAQASYSKSFRMLQDINKPQLRGEIFLRHARIAAEFGQTHNAARFLDSALIVLDRDIDPRERAEALLLKARIDTLRGSSNGLRSAQRFRNTLREAFGLLEAARTRTARQDLVGLFQTKTSIAYATIAEQMLEHCVAEDEALQYLETLHSRQLLESLERSGVLPDDATDQRLIREEEAMLFTMDSLRQSKIPTNNQSIGLSLDKAIREAEHELRGIQASISANRRSLDDTRRSRELRVGDIQQVLQHDEVFVEYAVFAEAAYAFVIPAGQRAHVVKLPIKAMQLEQIVGSYVRKLAAGYEERCSFPDDPRLFSALMEPIWKFLGTAKHLIIAPGPKLDHLPFEAILLPDRGDTNSFSYLIECVTVTYIHSGSVLRAVRMQSPQSATPLSLFAVGDPSYGGRSSKVGSVRDAHEPALRELAPPLYLSRGLLRTPVFDYLQRIPGTAREVIDLEKLFHSRGAHSMIALADAATAPTVLSSDLSAYSHIHFACHGFAGTPPLLALAPRTKQDAASYITLNDILHLRLPGTKMVALSACNTARGQQVRGEGVISLNRAFLATGCSNVLSTLWSVYDEATPDFIRNMYQDMIEKGRSPREALQTAKHTFIHTEEYAAPCYWAPFVLYGDGR